MSATTSAAMLFMDEVLDAFARFGPTLSLVIRTLRGGRIQPSEFEQFIEARETELARAALAAEFEDGK